jgi:hypothetical protein
MRFTIGRRSREFLDSAYGFVAQRGCLACNTRLAQPFDVGHSSIERLYELAWRMYHQIVICHRAPRPCTRIATRASLRVIAEPTGSLPRSTESVAQDHTQKRVVDFQAAVVLDESELPKFVHEEVHARTRRPHHLGERLLRHFRERPM